jgi:hypothetical protein
MTDITVNSRICGFTHKIHGEKNGKKINISIETDCTKVKKLAQLEVPMMELFDIKENFVIGEAQKARCCATCLVPCGILHVCNLESGFISQTLAKDAKNLSIEF